MVKAPKNNGTRAGKKTCEPGPKVSMHGRQKVTKWLGDDRDKEGRDCESRMV